MLANKMQYMYMQAVYYMLASWESVVQKTMYATNERTGDLIII